MGRVSARASQLTCSVGELVRSVRQTGAAPFSWRGPSPIAMAVVGVFGDSEVRALPEFEAIDNLATAAVTSWIMSEFDEDEYFAGDDIDLTMSPLTRQVEWGISPGSLTVLTAHLLSLGDIQESPAPVRSLASFIARQYNEDEAFEAMRMSQDGLVEYLCDPEPRVAEVPLSTEPSAAGEWIRSVALRGPRARRSYIYGLDNVLAKSELGLPAEGFIEFGYPALWRHPEADSLAETLADIYPWVSTANREAPLVAVQSRDGFTSEQDAFMRRIVIDRLCKLAVPRTYGLLWSFNNPELLLPFARRVAGRASSVRTRELAEILARVTTESLVQSEGRKRYYSEVFERENAHAFTIKLATRVVPVALLVGAAVGSLGGLPDMLMPIIGLIALYFLHRQIIKSRGDAEYKLPEYPTKKSLIVGLVLAAGYALSMSGVMLAGSESAGVRWQSWLSIALVFLVWSVYLTFAVKYPHPPRLVLSMLIPGLPGIPSDLDDATRQSIDEWADHFEAGSAR
jgi:hypothetical protein